MVTCTDPPLLHNQWQYLELRESQLVCKDQYLFRINLPGPNQKIGDLLDHHEGGCGQYIAIRSKISSEEHIIRYYSPISRPDSLGYVDLLLKIDVLGGVMSYILRDLQPGQKMEFRGMLGSRSLNFSNGIGSSITQPPDLPLVVKKLVLICGGTGKLSSGNGCLDVWDGRHALLTLKFKKTHPPPPN